MTVFVNAIMYYKVKNAIHAVANVDDYSGSARLLAATTLRNVLGTLTLGDILCQREAIAREMKDVLDEGTEPWGVTVERVEVCNSSIGMIYCATFLVDYFYHMKISCCR